MLWLIAQSGLEGMILHNRSHTPCMPGPQKNLWEPQATVVPSRKKALVCQAPAAPLQEGLSINPGGLSPCQLGEQL